MLDERDAKVGPLRDRANCAGERQSFDRHNGRDDGSADDPKLARRVITPEREGEGSSAKEKDRKQGGVKGRVEARKDVAVGEPSADRETHSQYAQRQWMAKRPQNSRQP